jgi:hypothetical protein
LEPEGGYAPLPLLGLLLNRAFEPTHQLEPAHRPDRSAQDILFVEYGGKSKHDEFEWLEAKETKAKEYQRKHEFPGMHDLNHLINRTDAFQDRDERASQSEMRELKNQLGSNFHQNYDEEGLAEGRDNRGHDSGTQA